MQLPQSRFIAVPLKTTLCRFVAKPLAFSMLTGQPDFQVFDFNGEAVLRNNIDVFPKMTVNKMARRYRSQRIQSNQMSIFRNTCFFKSFAARGLFGGLVVFTTAGNPLPYLKVGTLEKQIARLPIRVNPVRNN